jgi:hypothetical protein
MPNSARIARGHRGTTFAVEFRMGPVIDRLTRNLRRLARRASELQNAAVDIESELAVFQRILMADHSGRLEAAINYAAARGREARLKEQLRTAAVGASKVETRPRANGALLVRIDEGQWFRLARRDAAVFMLLAQAPAASDGFPGWKSYEDISDYIAQKTGSRPTRRALIESVFRIRKTLKEADLNQFLLRVEAKPGRLRFLLRSPAAASV